MNNRLKEFFSKYSPILIEQSEISNFSRALSLEWLISNGLGSYSSSTVLGINTRKYHGLFVVALSPPGKRHVVLSKFEEELNYNDKNYSIYSNEFDNTIYPDGFKRLVSFCLNPFPTFYYKIEDIYLAKRIFLPHHRNLLIVEYEITNGFDSDINFNIKPLLTFRHFHDTINKNSTDLNFNTNLVSNGIIIEIKPHNRYLLFTASSGKFLPTQSFWIEKIFFRKDYERGDSCFDDQIQTGLYSIKIPEKSKKKFYITSNFYNTREEVLNAISKKQDISSLNEIITDDLNYKNNVINKFYRSNNNIARENWLNWLILSADSFIVKRLSTNKKSIIAGYHWFEDWGRDTLISLSGLTLVTGRYKIAEEILKNFGDYCKNGLIPNRFPDKEGNKAVYDSVDASLWYINAIFQYIKYTGNLNFVRKSLWKILQEIISNYVEGTLFDIKLDNDGLLSHGPRLTWMDVLLGGKPVTPRDNKAVEIQALWYNALCIMNVFSKKFGMNNDSEIYRAMAEKVKINFKNKFWYKEKNYLYDSVKNNYVDPALRPNQIFAVSLDFTMLNADENRKIVQIVKKNLLGPYGLKTLTSNNTKFVGKYVGSISQRDIAYHNGTIWGWLLGPFVTAFLKVKKHEYFWRDFAFKHFMQPILFEETLNFGLGTISEIFDAEYPYKSRGCISQAWSVAELLRTLIEDIYLNRPSFENKFLDNYN